MLIPGATVPDRIRKRALSSGSPADPPAAKKAATGDVPEPTVLDNAPPAITSLLDLSAELHGEFIAYMPPADVVQYGKAVGPRLRALGEIDAAALRVRILQARTLSALKPFARRFGTIGPAFRDQVVHQMLVVLRDAALKRPLAQLLPLADLLQQCAQAAVTLVPVKARRLESACLLVALSVGWRFAPDGITMITQLGQLPPLLPADRSRTLMGAMQAIKGLLDRTPLHAPMPPGLYQALAAVIDRIGGLPPKAAQPLLQAAFAVFDMAYRRPDLPFWWQARGALLRTLVGYPMEMFHQVVPTDDDQFVDVAMDLMHTMPPRAQREFFDALLAAAPTPPAQRLTALTNMASLLSEIPEDAVLERIGRLVALGRQLHPDLLQRQALLEELASDATFRALPRSDVPAAMRLLLAAVRDGAYRRGTAESLLDDVSHRAGRAPRDQQDLLWHEVQAARPH